MNRLLHFRSHHALKNIQKPADRGDIVLEPPPVQSSPQKSSVDRGNIGSFWHSYRESERSDARTVENDLGQSSVRIYLR